LIKEYFLIHSLDDLFAWTKRLAKQIHFGMVVALYGELGVGKTTLVQMLSRHLGYQGYVHSPSFSLMNIYPLKQGKIIHIDAFRLQPDTSELGVDDVIGSDTLVFIEWPQHLKRLPDGPLIQIHLAMGEDQQRRITIEGIKLEETLS
jgi:tRNA threonylcarbamoyladenosine biosynthesis protein TsaE